ncbi:TetR/AcrR family transcriptional regulator [Roseicyclus mahoneyensis]|uniref:TetR family transcriptional regulator n=1 Tax=Roseicyclus mahoneyensis TaxID=164332 RepID=A0A316GMF2_9RHOB|nr:TetR/AcrR family transcriptional regulator [Roseicyclus mahoneyensis]PWK62350.1 TetR family transcriptional regulator [Roseicyclus mahoneyensis]
MPKPDISTPSKDRFADWLAEGRAGLPKGERTRRDLMIAGAHLLARQPLEDLTVAAVCARAGVAHGTFYIYFPNRNLLAGAVLEAFVDHLQIEMRAAARGAPDPVRATTAAYMRLFAENAGLMRCLVVGLDALPAARLAFQRLNHDWIATVVTAARRRDGANARPEADLTRRAHALGGMVDQYLTALHVTQDPQIIALSQDRDAVLDLFTDLWTKGMAP